MNREEARQKRLAHLPNLNGIALRLFRIRRFAGDGNYAYTVGQHSLTVGFLAMFEHLTGGNLALAFLHDACEALVGDRTYPWKTEAESDMEKRLQQMLLAHLGLTRTLAEAMTGDVEGLISDLDDEAASAEIVVLGIDEINCTERALNLTWQWQEMTELDLRRLYREIVGGLVCT